MSETVNAVEIIARLRIVLTDFIDDMKLKTGKLSRHEKELYEVCSMLYELRYELIHKTLANDKTDENEQIIREQIRNLQAEDLIICKQKKDDFYNKHKKAKEEKNKYFEEAYYASYIGWKRLYYKNMKLGAYRNFELFCLLWEQDFPSKMKVIAPSLNPYDDNGYTGVNKPFIYYFNRMVLLKDIRFMSKQYPTGYGKSLTNYLAIAWALGVDKENDFLVVLGNPTLVASGTKTICDIISSPFYVEVFPEYEKYCNNGVVSKDKIFSFCRTKDGEITLAGTTRALNVKLISKDTSIDGIRARFLMLDDICRSKDATNLKQHETDIANYWNSWWKRNYNTNDFYIIAGGTAYNVNDILSYLIRYYSRGKLYHIQKGEPHCLCNKYTYINEAKNCIFIKVPKIDFDFGRSTYPSKFPLEEALKLRERNYESFEAMEQQNPKNPQTSPLSYEKLNLYYELPSGMSDYALACLDPARTGNNYVTMGIHRVRKETDKYNNEIEVHYLVDCIFQLDIMANLYDEIINKIEHHHITKLHVENNTDTSLANLLRQKLSEKGIMFCEITEQYSTENKERKLKEVVYANENYFKTIMKYPDSSLHAPASQMGKFMNYFTSYSYNTKLEYDDSIDEECMYIQKFIQQKNKQNKIKIIYR